MRALVCLSLLCLIAQVFGQATITCTYTDPKNGYEYDLNPLVDNSADYVVQVQQGQDNITTQSYKITLNVCRPIFNQACAQQASTVCDACQQWPLDNPKYQNALGKTTSTSLNAGEDTSGTDGEGVTMLYGGFTSTLVVNFVCDMNAGKGHPVYVTKPTGTEFLLKWKSKYACATNGKAISEGGSGGGSGSSLSGGSIMMIIVLVVVVVYVAAGVAWQKFKNHAEGTDLIPNKEFWISLPGLVKDGVLFIYHKIRGGNSSYQKF